MGTDNVDSPNIVKLEIPRKKDKRILVVVWSRFKQDDRSISVFISMILSSDGIRNRPLFVSSIIHVHVCAGVLQ